jgi:hypothetical protein
MKSIGLICLLVLCSCGSGSSPAPVAVGPDSVDYTQYALKTPQQYGAGGFGITDDSDSLENSGKSFTLPGALVLNGNFRITRDIRLQKIVDLIGVSAQASQITGPAGGVYIYVTGQSPNLLSVYRNIKFVNVSIRYGFTTADYGVGATIDSCEFDESGMGGFGTGGMPTAIEWKNNSWNTSINACSVRGCSDAAVRYALGATGGNSGSNLKITNTVIWDSVVGVMFDGNSLDGINAMLEADNIEHCDTAMKVVNGGDGLISVSDSHFELNRKFHVDSNGRTVVNLNNCWMGDNSAYPGFNFFSVGNANILVQGGRIMYRPENLAISTGTGNVIIQ